MNFISKKKEVFKKKIKENQDARFKSNQEHLIRIKKERKELQVREDVRTELQQEKKKVSDLKYAKVREGFNRVKKALPKSNNAGFGSSGRSVWDSGSSSKNVFSNTPEPKKEKKKKRIIIEV